MIKIAIVEDTNADAQTLQSHLQHFANENQTAFHTTVFHNAIAFLENYTAKYDIIFMDIALPYLNGMDAAHALRELDPNVLLIFITSLSQYAVQGYDVDAFAYLVKPVSYADFALKFVRAHRRLATRDTNDLVLNTKQGCIKLNPQEILYCEVSGHKTLFHTTRGDYIQHMTLSAVEKKLNDELFCKCNHCYLVNLRHVKQVFGDEVEIFHARQSIVLHMSRGKRKHFCDTLKIFWDGMSQKGEANEPC